MNHDHLKTLCNVFNLGMPVTPAKPVHGGLLHRMWSVNTDKGSYAIKQLSTHIDLSNEQIVNNYNLTEEIASRFSIQGVPAISAIKQVGTYLTIINGIGFLVYPWVDAQPPLDHDTISEYHALKIAEVLAQMHLIHLDAPQIEEPVFGLHTNEDILELIHKSERLGCPFAHNLRINQDKLISINDAYKKATQVLKKDLVVSHADLDQKNVLWDKNDNPILIDWESAGKLNATYDIINTAFYWSGITTDDFNQTLFIKIIDCYQKMGGIINRDHLEAAFYGTFGWINWMVYNIERACTVEKSEERSLGIEQVNQTLETIIRLQRIIPDLLAKLTEQQNIKK